MMPHSEVLNELLGTPVAPDKRQPMAAAGTFLGLTHDLTDVQRKGHVSFGARDKLHEKLRHMLAKARSDRVLSPGQAANIYGLANFFEQGMYGRIGCSGLGAVKQRQLSKEKDLTPELEQCFAVLDAVFEMHPAREINIAPRAHPRFVAASDAALEAPQQGTGGFLLVFFNDQAQERLGFVSEIPDILYQLWSPGDAKIAQLELLQVLIALVTVPERFRGRRGVWYMDNTASLMALIKGRSASHDLEKMSCLIHLLLFSLRCWIYWEWVPSKSN